MSNALGIAAVTAVLKDLLDNALVDHSINTILNGQVKVTALAPDLIPVGSGEAPSINLFLYRVTPNLGWRNVDLPSRRHDGGRGTNPPLALDLHYLLTAYAAVDFQAEILLGYAMQRLHETPGLSRDAVRTALAAVSPVDGSILPPSFSSLSASDLAEQVELIEIAPQSLSSEEISKLWTSFQASYRPSAAYCASVVLIESQLPSRSALPVLTRGERDPVTGREEGVAVQADLTPPYPTLVAVRPSNGQPSAYLGDTVELRGHHLSGTSTTVIVEHPRLDAPFSLTPATQSNDTITVVLADDPPNDPANWAAGFYTVRVELTVDGATRRSNQMALTLAPRVDAIAAATQGDTTTFTVTTSPAVRPAQASSLVVGEREVFAPQRSNPTDELTFEMEDLAPGTYWARLRVDGAESLLVDRSTDPPNFLTSQQVTV